MLATATLDQLAREATRVVSELAAAPDDPVLGLAFHRLVSMALAGLADESLVPRLIRLGERDGAPAHLAEAARVLRTARSR